MSYYEINDILSEQQRIPCTFKSLVPYYGHMDSSNEEHLAENTRIELPFWLAEPLATSFVIVNSSELVDIEIPACFQDKVFDDLEASAKRVNFSMICPYFYRFSRKLTLLVEDEQLQRLVSAAFVKRLHYVLELIYGQVDTDACEMYSFLDETERLLFKKGQLTEKELSKWLKGQANRLKSWELN